MTLRHLLKMPLNYFVNARFELRAHGRGDTFF